MFAAVLWLVAAANVTQRQSERLVGIRNLTEFSDYGDLTEEQKLFYRFKQTDLDNDDRLDGLELHRAVFAWRYWRGGYNVNISILFYFFKKFIGLLMRR